MKPKILIVDDEQLVLNALNRALNKDCDVILSLSGRAALQVLREQAVSVIVSDQRMPEMTGVELFKEAFKIQPSAKRILLTGYSDREAMIEAINTGQIYHYIQKPWEPHQLKQRINQAVELFTLERENSRLTEDLKRANEQLSQENRILTEEVETHYTFDSIIGESKPMREVFALMKKVIPTNVTVFIQGETGTGKELVAKAIHYNGPRKNNVFAAQNCAAVQDTLLESTLFGHKKGSFTDAIKDQKGLFEIADGGTVFLDEIGEMSPAMQQRLLRVLQDGEIQSIGATSTKKVDVRIISATHVDLKEAVRLGTFREDLFFRLHVMPIGLPPLRGRIDDVPVLVNHFISKNIAKGSKGIAGISAEAMDRLKTYGYPGNIRELENIIDRACIITESGVIDINSLSGLDVIHVSRKSTLEGSTLPEAVYDLEIEMIKRALSQTHGNVSQAAKNLGISRMGLYKKIKRLNL